VIPANRKWYRDVVVARVVVDALQEMNPRYPETHIDFSKIVIE
jgi:hypothetical protein